MDKLGNIFYMTSVGVFFSVFSFWAIDHDVKAITADPVCQSARAALDVVNSQREEKHVRK